jgi:hypothetical protein
VSTNRVYLLLERPPIPPRLPPETSREQGPECAMNIRRLHSLLFVSCIILPIPVGFVMSWLYDTVSDENIYFALRWLLLPAMVVTGFALWNKPGNERTWRHFPGILLSSVIVGIFATFMLSASFVLLINALTAFGAPVSVQGPIVEKLRAGYGGTGPSVVIVDSASGERAKIYVPQREWSSLELGQSFGKRVKRGGLGIRFYPSAYRQG